MLNADCIYGHGTHLDADAIAKVNAAGLAVGHNTRSNMNNGVGYAPIGKFQCPVQLGTDGIGADMFEEARTAWFKSCDGHAGITPADVLAMMANSARRASKSLGVTLGKLESGAAADVVITDYIPATPLSTDNAAGQFLFAMAARHVKDVLANGEWALRNRVVQTCDEAKIRNDSRAVTKRLWERLEKIPC